MEENKNGINENGNEYAGEGVESAMSSNQDYGAAPAPVKEDVSAEVKTEVKEELKTEATPEPVSEEVTGVVKAEVKEETRPETKYEPVRETVKTDKKTEEKKSKAWIWIVAAAVGVIAIGLLVYFLCFYKNKNIRDTEAAIDAIGTVTLDSGYQIDEAEEMYAALTEKEQEKVDNLQVLEDARDEYTELCDRDAAAKVDELIASIGTVTRESEGKIDDAREAYDSLTKKQKKYVENLDDLEAAEEEFELLDVKECEELINKIADAADSPDVELPIAIGNARTAYDNLSASHKKLVSNYANLETAEQAYDTYCTQNDAVKIQQEHAERLENREEYMNSCQAVTYAQLISNPDTYEGKDISLRVDIIYVEEAGFLKEGTVGATPAGGNVDNVISLVDKRTVKEPVFAQGTSVTVYGVFEGVNTVTSYVEGTGILGTSLFAEVDTETLVPEITVNFTSTDDIEAIDSKPTKTEIFNYIEDGLDLAKDLTDVIKKLPW